MGYIQHHLAAVGRCFCDGVPVSVVYYLRHFYVRDVPFLAALRKEFIEAREVRVRTCVSVRRAVRHEGLRLATTLSSKAARPKNTQ